MQEALDALQFNHAWGIVPRPLSAKPIGCKWIYSLKLKLDGSLDRYKAQLVDVQNRQEYGIDYEETFSPTAKMNTVYTMQQLQLLSHDLFSDGCQQGLSQQCS